MANKNPPAHDFAPAWLKIPTYDTFKPSGAPSERSGHTSRRDEHSYSFTRHNRDNDSSASHQSHCNDYRKDKDAASRERKNSYMPSYHHSIDFDDSYSSVNNSHYYDNGYNGSSCNNQTVLSRRPHSRHDFRISVSYSKAENLAKQFLTNNSGGYYGHKVKGKVHDSSYHSNNGIADVRGMGVSSNYFNQEFPSLQGDISEEPSTPPPPLNGSAWEKPRNINVHNAGIGKKIQLVKKPSKTEISCESSRKSPASSSSGPLTNSSSVSSSSNPHTVIITPVAKSGSSTYRALIPAKSTQIKKPPKEGLKVAIKKSSTTPPPSTHSMEILVKHPKAPGNKSEFLKTLRNEKKEVDEAERDFSEKNIISNQEHSLQDLIEEPHVNGIDISKLSCNEEEKSILSSSLEAEERLLREMGWKEEVSDDENYAPLTEDELKEFRDRSEKIVKKNGIRRNLLSNLSPLRLAPFTTVPLTNENTSSSSESDSDF